MMNSNLFLILFATFCGKKYYYYCYLNWRFIFYFLQDLFILKLINLLMSYIQILIKIIICRNL